MSDRTLALNIGKREDIFYLVLADQDTSDAWPLAQFVDVNAMEAFTLYMQSQGYSAIQLPSEDELSEFFE